MASRRVVVLVVVTSLLTACGAESGDDDGNPSAYQERYRMEHEAALADFEYYEDREATPCEHAEIIVDIADAPYNLRPPPTPEEIARSEEQRAELERLCHSGGPCITSSCAGAGCNPSATFEEVCEDWLSDDEIDCIISTPDPMDVVCCYYRTEASPDYEDDDASILVKHCLPQAP